jgi:DmsE family decaheme c-type cytochrome
MTTRALFFCAAFAAVLLFLAFSTPASAQPNSGGYADTAVCLDCHQDVADALAMTQHGKSGYSQLSDHGCQGCHGPAAAHADDPGDESLIPSIDDLSADEQTAICQGCHKGGQQFFWNSGTHKKRNLSCATCHSVHNPASAASQLKAPTVAGTRATFGAASVDALRTQELCFECHKDVRAETWKRSHHPLREGEISCADCHNPHGTQNESMLRTASVNETCYGCHAEKRGPFLWEHAPVRESCLNCHTPHGSNHFKLQKTSSPFLCQQCHANTRHPGTLYDRTTNADGTRPSSREFNRGCPNCHAAVHGSNHPSSPYLAH